MEQFLTTLEQFLTTLEQFLNNLEQFLRNLEQFFTPGWEQSFAAFPSKNTIFSYFWKDFDENFMFLVLFRENPRSLVALPVFTKLTHQQKNTIPDRNCYEKT